MVEAPRRSTVVMGRTGKNVVTYLQGESLLPVTLGKRFDSIQLTGINEHEGITGNDKFTAFPWGGAGTVAVLKSYDYKRLPFDFPMIKCHNGNVTTLAFSPFQDRLLMTGS